MKNLVTVAFLVCVVSSLWGQQLDQIGKKGSVKISGGVGVNQSLYFVSGVKERYNPHNYVVNGNVTISAIGMSFPISFTYSNQKFGHSGLPFNIVGVSPTYKNLTLHGGFRNMTFSKYTLAGHTFLGGGAEYKKKKWSFSAMGGRLLKEVEYDSSSSIKPVFRRVGYGASVGYANNGNEVKFITFYAKDIESSISLFPETEGIRPLENQVYSISIKKRLNKVVSLRFEGAQSGVTEDKRDTVLADHHSFIRESLYFIPIKSTTVFSGAFNAGVDLAIGKTKIGASIERVDGDYKTLGAYYINGDFQNVNLSFSRPLWKDRISFSSQLGLQKDDLKKEKLSSMRRVVYSMNAGITLTKKVKLSLTYSNFNSIVNVKPIERQFAQNSDLRNVDTLNFQQINSSYGASLTYAILDNTNYSHNLSANANYNASVNETPTGNQVSGVASASTVYALKLKKSKTNISVNVNANRNEYVQGKALFVGAGLSASKQIFKEKVSVSLTANGMNNYEGERLTARLFTLNNNYSLKMGKKHSLSGGVRVSSRVAIQQAELSYYKTSFRELFVNLGYNYRF